MKTDKVFKSKIDPMYCRVRVRNNFLGAIGRGTVKIGVTNHAIGLGGDALGRGKDRPKCLASTSLDTSVVPYIKRLQRR